MLTNIDLKKIGDLVDNKLENKLTQKLHPIKNDLKKIRQDLEYTIGVLDKDRWKLEKRVDKLEATSAS